MLFIMSHYFATAYLKVVFGEDRGGEGGLLRPLRPLPGQVCKPDIFAELFYILSSKYSYYQLFSGAASTTEEEGEVKEEKVVKVKEETGNIVL